MSTIRELAKTAYTLAITRPTGNAGIDVIEDAIQAAVNDHTRALADALEAILGDMQTLAPARECTMATARAALRSAGRLP